MRVQLLSPDAAHLVGFAKKKLRQLKELREKTGQAIWSKNITVGDFQIYLETANWGDKIRLSGGTCLDHILLESPTGLFGYNWERNALNERTTFSGELEEANAYRVDMSLGEWLLASQGKVSKIGGQPFSKSTPAPNIGAVIYEQDGLFYVRLADDTIVSLGSVAVSVQSDLLWRKAKVSFLTTLDSSWNQLNTQELWNVGINTGGSLPAEWRWVPRLWHPEPANSQFLPPGIYYANGSWGPCNEIRVSFGAVLRNKGGTDNVGYCEILGETSICESGDGPNCKAFFFYKLWTPGKNFYFQNVFQRTTFQHNYWTSAQAHAHDFAIYYDDEFTTSENVEIDWWAAEDLPPDPLDIWESPRHRNGIIAFRQGGPFVFSVALGRTIGTGRSTYTVNIKTGEGYVSHSSSHNGQIVAILYDGGNKLFVYDMEEETEGVHKVLQDTDKVSGKGFSSLAVIPAFKDDELSKDVPFASSGSLVSGYDPLLGVSLFGMNHPYPEDRGVSASGWTVEVQGKEAIGKLWHDECWKRTSYGYTYLNPGDGMGLFPKLIIYNNDPTAGIFSYAGVGEKGSIINGGEMTLTPAGGHSVMERKDIYMFQGGGPYFFLEYSANAKAPVNWSGDVFYTGIEDRYVVKFTCGEANVTLSDDCGETSTKKYIDPDYEESEESELFLIGPDAPGVGSQYSASGGEAPYSFSFSGGSIDSTGKITSVSSCGGPDGNGAIAHVTVTDACGKTAAIQVRLDGGAWLQTATNYDPGGGCFPHNGPLTYSTTTGGTRVDSTFCWITSGNYGTCASTWPDSPFCCQDCSMSDAHPEATGTTIRKYIWMSKQTTWNWVCP